jgi:HK97 family phage major capsid protein
MNPVMWSSQFGDPSQIATPSYGQGSIPFALRAFGLVAMAMIGMAPYTGTAGVALHEQDLDSLRTLEEKEAYQADVEHRMSAMVAEANGLPFSDEKKAEFTGLKNAHTAIEKRIAEQSYLLGEIASFGKEGKAEAADGADPGAAETPSFVRPAGSISRRPEATRIPSNVFDLGAYRRHAPMDGQYKQAIIDGARKAIDGMTFFYDGKSSEAIKQDLHGLIEKIDNPVAFGEHIVKCGGPAYNDAFARYLAVTKDGLREQERYAIELGSDPAGGYTLPVQLDPTIIRTSDGTINSLRGIARTERITGKKWQGVTGSGIVVRRGAEKSRAVPTDLSLGGPEIESVKVDAFIPFTIEYDVAQGGAGQVLSQVAPLVSDAKDEEESDSFVNGDGQGTEPGGLLGTMPDGSRLAVTDFGVEDLFRLDGTDPNALAARWRARAKFLAAKGIYNEVRQFGDGLDGATLWVRLGDSIPPGLLGYPSPEQSTMPATSAEDGSDFMVLGDFNQFLIVDRIGMTVEVIPHLTQQQTAGAGYGIPVGMRGIYVHWHNNARILVPNAFRVLHKGAVGSGS